MPILFSWTLLSRLEASGEEIRADPAWEADDLVHYAGGGDGGRGGEQGRRAQEQEVRPGPAVRVLRGAVGQDAVPRRQLRQGRPLGGARVDDGEEETVTDQPSATRDIYSLVTTCQRHLCCQKEEGKIAFTVLIALFMHMNGFHKYDQLNL